MNDETQFAGGVEPMIDAKQAAAALRLPYYWFADHQMRSKYRIPHYLMGGWFATGCRNFPLGPRAATQSRTATNTTADRLSRGSNDRLQRRQSTCLS
ncbi:hypothetical protein [Candidatus Dactylopiibacterium carminicum]|uniref:hypothetical protein n=1 Tax=Candidatus Dactylopiibacterium carminicum TaxID=857335 RepID=UPI001CC321A2|nr:hypothetical protein [Candidatus Dactylopiibacterium carminicum]